MPSKIFSPGSGAGALILASATVAALAATAVTAQARTTARIAMVAPASRIVSGSIPFAARVGRNVKTVEFKIDGRRRWKTARRPFRYDRTGVLNTRKLRNGSHVLVVEAFYPNRVVRTARKSIVVMNSTAKRKRRPTTPPPAALRSVGVLSPPVGGIAGAGVAALNRETYNYSTSFNTTQEANNYQVMVLQATNASMVPALHAANPNLIILMYQHPWYSRTTDPNALTICTSYPNDIANHPDWFLRDQNGNTIPTNSTNYLMDVGNPAYQQACMANATSLAKKYGFDGVFLDGIGSTLQWELPRGTSVPEYPTVASFQAGMTSLVNYAGQALHAQGLKVFGNICGSTLTRGVWQQYAAPLDGAEEESWTDGGLGLAQQNRDWATKLANVAWSVANGKSVILHSYNTTETGNTFGMASMMLVANGQVSYATSNANYTSAEVMYPEYATAEALGAPAASYTKLTNGVYERPFSRGIVLVNSAATAASSFSLGGGIYSGSGLRNVTSVSMAPDSALILLKVG